MLTAVAGLSDELNLARRRRKGGRKGRPRKTGERHPSGDLRNPDIDNDPLQIRDGLPPAAVKRIMQGEEYRSELDLLHHRGLLTDVHREAGKLVGRIYRQYEALKGLPRRWARTADLGTTSGTDAPADPDDVIRPVADAKAQAKAADRALVQFKDLADILNKYSGPLGAIRYSVERLCVDDQRIDSVQILGVRRALEDVAFHFRLTRQPPVNFRQAGWEIQGAGLMPSARPKPQDCSVYLGGDWHDFEPCRLMIVESLPPALATAVAAHRAVLASEAELTLRAGKAGADPARTWRAGERATIQTSYAASHGDTSPPVKQLTPETQAQIAAFLAKKARR